MRMRSCGLSTAAPLVVVAACVDPARPNEESSNVNVSSFFIPFLLALGFTLIEGNHHAASSPPAKSTSIRNNNSTCIFCRGGTPWPPQSFATHTLPNIGAATECRPYNRSGNDHYSRG